MSTPDWSARLGIGGPLPAALGRPGRWLRRLPAGGAL